MAEKTPHSVIYLVRVECIDANPFQVRALDEELLVELEAAIHENGLRGVLVGRLVKPDGTPVVDATEEVRAMQALATGKCRVQLAWGHHRLEAAKRAGILDVRVEIVPGLTDEAMASWALMENVRRRGLSAIEEARGIRRLVDDFGWTQERVAESLGYASAATVSNKLRLLRLPEEIQAKVTSGDVSERVARSLVAVAEISPKRAIELMGIGRPVSEYGIRQAKRDVSKPLWGGWEGAPWPMDWVEAAVDVAREGAATACKDCDQHVTMAVSTAGENKSEEVRCSKPRCWNRRRRAWEAQILAAESQKQGIPVLAEGEEKHTFTWRDLFSFHDRCETVQDGGVCEWVRLIYADDTVVGCCGKKEQWEQCVKEVKAARKVAEKRNEEKIEATRVLLETAAVELGRALEEGLCLAMCMALDSLVVRRVGWDEPREWQGHDDLYVHSRLGWKILTQMVDGLPRPYGGYAIPEDVAGQIATVMESVGVDWSPA